MAGVLLDGFDKLGPPDQHLVRHVLPNEVEHVLLDALDIGHVQQGLQHQFLLQDADVIHKP